jgi:GTPase SAR1 family protein
MIVGNKVDKVVQTRAKKKKKKKKKKKTLILTFFNLYKTIKASSRVVSYEEGAALARKLQSMFVECSAKTKIGVEEAFEELVTKVSHFHICISMFFLLCPFN